MTRINKLRQVLDANHYDAMIIHSHENLLYFTGFTGTSGLALVTAKEAYFITDSRYKEQANIQCASFTVIMQKESLWAEIVELILNTSKHQHDTLVQIAIEPSLWAEQYLYLVKHIPEVQWHPLALTSIRAQKEEEELELLRRAASIGDQAFADILPLIQAGKTEQELRIALESAMLHLGSEGPSFETIVASGNRSSMPHGVASEKVVEPGDFITFDFGAIYKGYHSDMTRTVVVGSPSEEQRRIYHILLESQEYGVSLVKEGASCPEIDKKVRERFAKDGLDAYFTHGLGHGVGIDVHELPVLSPRSKETLKVHDVVTVEPGLYFEGKWGLRIEDTLIVQEKGNEVITKTTKDLLELP